MLRLERLTNQPTSCDASGLERLGVGIVNPGLAVEHRRFPGKSPASVFAFHRGLKNQIWHCFVYSVFLVSDGVRQGRV